MTRKTITVISLAVLLVAGSPLLANQADGKDGELHEVSVHKIQLDETCEEGDCPHMQRRIFISEDGTTTELHGEDMKWVQAGAHHQMAFAGSRGFLGVQFNELTPELRQHFGVPASAGVMISKVVDDSPAQRAGVRVGDILTRVGDGEIASGRDLMKAVGHAEDGETINLEVWRANRVQTLAATIEAREGHAGMRTMVFEGGESSGAGLHKVIEIECDDDGGDCSAHHAGGLDLDFHEHCGDGEQCDVKVQCEDDGCTCTVNGEDVDCPEGVGG